LAVSAGRGVLNKTLTGHANDSPGGGTLGFGFNEVKPVGFAVSRLYYVVLRRHICLDVEVKVVVSAIAVFELGRALQLAILGLVASTAAVCNAVLERVAVVPRGA
jgi:hypothetical protein